MILNCSYGARVLDVVSIGGHLVVVKTLLLLSFATLSSLGQVVQVPPRQIVPMEVQMRAKEAVQEMVNKTLQQDFVAVADKIYPDYLQLLARAKRKTIAQVKAEEVAKLKAVGASGVTIDSMITLAPKNAFEVEYGVEKGQGGSATEAGYRSWMVFIPTVLDFSALDNLADPPRMRSFRKWGFQVAISKKDQESWTFVDGDGVNALELRKLFKFLPQDDKLYNFPRRDVQEIERK